MTYRRTNFNGLLALLTIAGVLLSNESLAACNFGETPLTNEKACVRFKAADIKLNRTYKKLVSELDSDGKSLLRSTQRAWIDWRDERCDQVQEDSRCENSLCNGVAHDICIIDLTNQRTQELEEYSHSTESAKKQRFAFTRSYK